MSEVAPGGMLAIIGLTEDRVNALMAEHRLDGVDIANYNAPAQLVVSGPHADLARARVPFEAAGATCIPLNVSAAFHSRQMQAAGDRFGAYLRGVRFSELNLPVISNVHATPYAQETIAETLQAQITRPVRWSHSIAFLLEQGETEFEEIGPGEVLTRLIDKIRKDTRGPAIVRHARNPSPASHQATSCDRRRFPRRVARQPILPARLQPQVRLRRGVDVQGHRVQGAGREDGQGRPAGLFRDRRVAHAGDRGRDPLHSGRARRRPALRHESAVQPGAAADRRRHRRLVPALRRRERRGGGLPRGDPGPGALSPARGEAATRTAPPSAATAYWRRCLGPRWRRRF